MRNGWRLLALAATLETLVGVTPASAQTVIVRQLPPGGKVEVVANNAVVGSGAADASGDARVEFNMFSAPGGGEIDAYLYLDVCENVHRVVIVERTVLPDAQEQGCSRRQISGLYLVRRISTLVVTPGGANPTILLRQGYVSLDPGAIWTGPPTGLVLGAGGSYAKLRDVVFQACGAVPECDGEGTRWGYHANVAFWFSRYLAAEATYIRPTEYSISGSGTSFRFDSALDPHVLTVGGKIGGPLKRLRVYGQAGVNYHRATFSTAQTNDDVTITDQEGTETVIEGGTQSFELRTAGWGWQFGGGGELWLSRFFAVYGEAGRAVLKGDSIDDDEGETDERMTYLVFGARVRIGG